MQGALDGDRAEHHLVAQRFAPEGHCDLRGVGKVATGRGRRGRQRQPAVAAKAAAPAQAVELARQRVVPRAELRSVGAGKHVAAKPAGDELPVDPPSRARPIRTGRVLHQLRMLTARETTSATTSSDVSDWTAISSLAVCDSGIVSVGLNAVAVVNESHR